MIPAEIPGTVLTRLSEIAADGMDIFLLDNGNYRGSLLNGTRMVNQMRANHDLGIMETLILGHAYLAAGLLTGLVKGNDRIRMDIDCDGPVGGLSVDSSAGGEIRGYLRNARLAIEAAPETFDTAPFIGSGTLTVTRHLERSKQPMSGHVRLEYGRISEDLAHYFLVSEQKPTAINLSVHFDRDGVVTGAGALFIQALPESDQSSARDLDEAVRNLPSIGASLVDGDTPAHLINTALDDFNPEIIGSRRIEMSCPCGRDRFERYLHSLPATEIADILEKGPFPVKVTCHYCNSTYMYEKEEFENIASR